MITFVVHGTPAPQGSKRHVGGGRMIESSAKVKPWREAVNWAALTGRETQPIITDPVDVTVTFTFPRPKSHYRTGRNAHLLRDTAPEHHTQKPDVDKLIRSTLDALTDAGLYADDSQVVRVTALKQWSDTGWAGADITIRSHRP